MPTVRLYQDQIDRLGRDPQAAIRLAVARYNRGEIRVKITAKTEKRSILPFSASTTYGVSAKKLRAIVDAHLAQPWRNVEAERERDKWDAICREQLNNMPLYFTE